MTTTTSFALRLPPEVKTVAEALTAAKGAIQKVLQPMEAEAKRMVEQREERRRNMPPPDRPPLAIV